MIKTTICCLLLASALSVPKSGPCPSGYRESGAYCAPMNDRARPAVPKIGACPSGWVQSGNYCLEMRPQRSW
jgi:hypothetical protein